MKSEARAGTGSRRLFGWISATVAAALVVTLAVVANGFDSREVPREDPTVWVERSAGQYARVNTETAEIDTVRVAESPSGVVQTGELGLLFTQGFGRAHPIQPASPVDVYDDGAEAEADPAGDASSEAPAGGDAASEAQEAQGPAAMRTPDGTRQVLVAGDRVLFFTQSGAAYLSNVLPGQSGSDATLSTPAILDPFAEENAEADAEGDETTKKQYVASAAALDEQGRIALYSNDEQAIRWFDAATGRWQGGPQSVAPEVPAEGVELAILDESWVLFDAENGTLWQQGRQEPTEIDTSGIARLQDSSLAGEEILVADEQGLWSVNDAGEVSRKVNASGVAAQPRYLKGEAIAAWVGQTGAQMWTSGGGEQSLELDPAVEDLSSVEPEIRTNGSRALIAERRSGMMWTVPDGTLIPVEQWSLVDPPKEETGTVVTQDVTEQEPPVAVDDVFGVRAGEPVLLPLLLNDFDPNRKDVLTVVSEGLGEGLDPDFGTLTQLSDGQGAVINPNTGIKGAASFTYRVTDGVNVSQPATVTLTAVPQETNTAPQWCAVEGCQRTWPSPEILPGGTVVLPILEAWVDPEGDPMMLAGASLVNSADPLRVLVTADGRLAIRHLDGNAPAGDFLVKVKVRDSWGAETDRDLRVRVRTGAAIEFTSAAVTAKVNEPVVVRPLERVTGGSGAFQLVDVAVQQGSVTVSPNAGTGTVELTASAAGNAIVNVTVRDSVTEQETTGSIRVTAVDARATFAVPPLRAFVRALADSTVDVLAAVPNAQSRALTVRSAIVHDGQLRADVIEHAQVRVSGSTADGQPGRIGSVDVVVAEGELTSSGRLTVFQVGEAAAGTIAVTDAATVRAGSVVDIPVLENDVAPPGERLVLHPEIGAPGVPGELAFASGSRVRYLAPKEPGVYTLSYTTYGASSPEQLDTGQVRVTVLATGSNRDPQPASVTVRVAPGERTNVSIPLSNVDPDGDRLRLVSVAPPEDPQLSTSIVPRTNSAQVEASASAQHGTQLVNYVVRDSFGGEARGVLRIIVTEPDSGGGAPVVYSDYVRIARGSSDFATVRPLDNDLDPSGGALQLVSVEPNVPGGSSSPDYQKLMDRIDLASLKQGIVRVQGGDELGTVSYRYTVKSSKTKSTADGLIVVQVSERTGQQAPSVIDTVLSVRDRADFARTGVDVVTDRVRWAGGDISSLKLSLWGGAEDDYEVDGSSIIGSYRAEGDLVPFRLAGVDMTGAEVETFGFLIVPPLDELRLSLKAGAGAISVAENKSIDVEIAKMLDLGPGDRVELEQTAFTTQRPQASCTAVDATTIRYSAGKEAPWADSCTIRVRLTDQTTYTLLPLAVSIVPNEPVVQLNPLTRTIAPGAAEAINLGDMVQWQGGRDGDASKLRWQIIGGTSAFEIAATGDQVQVQARADAVPGSQEILTVSVTGSGESQSLLTLRVGEAAVDAPRGGTVSLQCTVGSSCSSPLVGLSGEYDPFAGKSGGGLKLVSVDGSGCQVGSLQASGDSVSVSWADARGPGGQCKATFTVRDAQNRVGTGSIELDALGVPRAPVSVEATGADASSVTLTVTLNPQRALPGVTGVEILDSGGSAVATCSPSGGSAVCTVNNVPAGKENARQYLARAVNSVGASDPSSNASAPTWAYQAPPAPTVVATPVKNSRNTDTALGTVELRVDGSFSARRFLLSIDGGALVEIGRYSTHQVAPGHRTFSVIPQDQDLPPGYSGSAEGDAGRAEVVVGAAPILEGIALNDTSDSAGTSAEIVYSLNANFAAEESVQIWFGISTSDRVNCSQTSPVFSIGDRGKFKTYTGKICVSTEYGTTEVTTAPTWVGGNPPQLTIGDYTIAKNPSGYNGGVIYGLQSGPAVSNEGRVDGSVVSFSPGGSSLQLTPGEITTVTAVQCMGPNGEYCSAPSNAAGWVNAPTVITAVPNGACYAADAPPANPKSLLDIPGAGNGAATVTAGTPNTAQNTIPLTITWGGDFAGLSSATVSVCYTPTATPPTEPPPASGG